MREKYLPSGCRESEMLHESVCHLCLQCQDTIQRPSGEGRETSAGGSARDVSAKTSTTGNNQRARMRPNQQLARLLAFGYCDGICFSAKGAGSFKPGATPQGKVVFQKASAESANQWSRSFNPKRSVRRNQHRVCAAARGTPPQTCECDGALVAPRCIAAPHRADSGSPKTPRIRAARKSRDTEA